MGEKIELAGKRNETVVVEDMGNNKYRIGPVEYTINRGSELVNARNLESGISGLMALYQLTEDYGQEVGDFFMTKARKS